MSSLHPIAREIAVLSRAGYPLVYLVTQEEERALRLLEAASTVMKRNLVKWSASYGFTGGDPEAPVSDPADALDALAATAEAGIFVLLDFHPYLEDPKVVRRFRDRLLAAVEKRQT